MKQGLSIRFSNAIVRVPGNSCVDGISEAALGAPDPALFRTQHARYVALLQRAGVATTTLPPQEDFPDSVFIEDPALCLPQVAILLRSGAASRQGEARALQPALRKFYADRVLSLPRGALADGGDILVTDTEILIGISARTNQRGAAAIQRMLEPWGYCVRTVATPAGILHLKTDCASLGGDRVLTTTRLAASGVFDSYDAVLAAEGEEAAANAIRVNDTVFVANGYDRTAAAISEAGLNVQTVDVSETPKLNTHRSCMSLRFSPSI